MKFINNAYIFFLAFFLFGCAGFVANKSFNSIDRNNDGKITFDEYPREDFSGTKRSEKQSRAEFNKDDKNKDGIITREELLDSMLDHK